MLFEDNTFYIMTRFLLTLCGTFGMTASVTKFNRNYKRNIILFSAYILYAFVSAYLYVCFFGYFRFLRIFILTITVPAIIMMYFISEETLPRLVFTRVMQLLFSVYVAGSATLLNNLLHGNMLSSLLLLVLFYALVIALEFLFLRRRFLYIADTVKKGWGILSLIPCALTILEIQIAIYPKHYTEYPPGVVLSYLLLAVSLVIYTVIFLYLLLLHKQQMSERNMDILKVQVQNIRRENEALEALEKQARIIRHDRRHMLSVIASLAEKEDRQAILDYIGKISGAAAAPEPTHICNDLLLNTTLSNYFNYADNMGYTIDTSLSIPDALPTDSAEFSICFANALECVLCLSGDVPETELPISERTLAVKCIHQPKLMFEVSGPCKRKLAFDKNGVPRAEDTDLNLNINSIREFCKRQDAVSSFTAENGRFTVKVAL